MFNFIFIKFLFLFDVFILDFMNLFKLYIVIVGNFKFFVGVFCEILVFIGFEKNLVKFRDVRYI